MTSFLLFLAVLCGVLGWVFYLAATWRGMARPGRARCARRPRDCATARLSLFGSPPGWQDFGLRPGSHQRFVTDPRPGSISVSN